jgi:hypothetical protein
MKFIFFYSELYEYHNNHIYSNISNLFDLESIKINNLKNDKGGHTFFGGVSIKIELIIRKITENIGNSIIFTDATIFINSNNTNELPNFFNEYINNDICFADNDGNGYYNIGIMLIKCNEKTLNFFKNVLIKLINTKGWDQDIINTSLHNDNNLKIDVFNREKIYCGYEFNPSYKNTYLIYKSFISHDKNIILNFNKRLDIFKKYELIEDDEYNNNYKKILIPKNQKLLIQKNQKLLTLLKYKKILISNKKTFISKINYYK